MSEVSVEKMIPQNSLPPKAWTQYQGHRPTIGTNACSPRLPRRGSGPRVSSEICASLPEDRCCACGVCMMDGVDCAFVGLSCC